MKEKRPGVCAYMCTGSVSSGVLRSAPLRARDTTTNGLESRTISIRIANVFSGTSFMKASPGSVWFIGGRIRLGCNPRVAFKTQPLLFAYTLAEPEPKKIVHQELDSGDVYSNLSINKARGDYLRCAPFFHSLLLCFY